MTTGQKFIVSYLVWVAVLYLLFFNESFSPLFIFNVWQTELTVWLTRLWVDLLAIPVNMVGSTIHLDNGFDIWILQDCNGMEPYWLYVAGILAYPNHLTQKLLWIFYGYLFVLVLNTIRIDIVVYITMLNRDAFELVHDFIGRTVMLFLTLGLYVFYSWLTEKKRAGKQT